MPVSSNYEYSRKVLQLDHELTIFTVIIDENKGRKSVTNDMENILNEIFNCFPNRIKNEERIIYRDSRRLYDGVIYKDGLIEFVSLNEKYQHRAMVAMGKYLGGECDQSAYND